MSLTGPVIRSHVSRIIVVGMRERTGAGSVSIADRPFQGLPVGVAGEQLQNTADGIGVVIMSVAAVVDGVLSASMDPALERAQLSEKLRAGTRGRFYNVVDLVNRLETEARNARQGRLADHLTRMDFVILGCKAYFV